MMCQYAPIALQLTCIMLVVHVLALGFMDLLNPFIRHVGQREKNSIKQRKTQQIRTKIKETLKYKNTSSNHRPIAILSLLFGRIECRAGQLP